MDIAEYARLIKDEGALSRPTWPNGWACHVAG